MNEKTAEPRKLKDQKNYKEQNGYPFKANYCHRKKA